jgi:hypothetical protein
VTVVLTQPVEGKQPGDTYTGAREAYLLASGYASQAGYEADAAAVLTGTSNAVNIVTGGNLVVRVGHETYTVALAAADTPAAAATKIDTALTGADAAIVSSKLVITSTATGDDDAASVGIVSGTGTVLANLGVAAGASAVGSTGGIGLANTGPADLPVASNPEFNSTRGQVAGDGGTPEAGTNEGDLELHNADAPFVFAYGDAFGAPEDVPFTGFANGVGTD